MAIEAEADPADRTEASPRVESTGAVAPWTRLGAHAVALSLLLVALAPLVGVHRAVFDADEGGQLLQVDVLRRTGTPYHDYWALELDPDIDFSPVEHAVANDVGQLAPMVRRPNQTLALYVADVLGGLWAMVALGCIAIGVAAYATARVARRLDPSLEVPALWSTGLATPLAFDAFVLRGHALGTAFTALAVLAAVRCTFDRTTWPRLTTVFVALTVAGALRKEAIYVAVGLAVAVAVRWFLERRPDLVRVATALAGAVPAGIGLDLLIGRVWFGSSFSRSVPAAGGTTTSFLEERLRSLWTATFRPAYEVSGSRPGALALLVAVVLGVVVVVHVRDRRDGRALVAGLAVVIVLVAARVTLLRNAPDLAPGLFAAAPLLLWGVVALPRTRLAEREASFLAIAAALAGGAVVATQYAMGGAWEWGARYMEVALPLVVPLAVLGLASLVGSIDRPHARLSVALLAGVALSLTTSGLVAQREARLRVEEQIATSLELAAGTDSHVVISTFPSLPRSAVDQLREGQRWLWVWPDGLPPLLAALDAGGIDDAVLVSHDEQRSDAALDETDWSRDPSEPLPANPGEWRISTIRSDTAP